MAIFISYRHKDEVFAVELRERLEAAGFPTWMDKDITAGELWKPAIDSALKRSDIIIVVVSSASLISPYVTYEWSFALGLKKHLIPLAIEEMDLEGIHPKLNERQCLDFVNPETADWEDLITQLLKIEFEPDLPPELKNARDRIYDPDKAVRAKGFDTLKRHPNTWATKILLEAIDSEDLEISGGAGIALAQKTKSTDNRAILGLDAALRLYDYFKEAVSELAAMNNEEAVSCLSDCFDELAREPNNEPRIEDLMDEVARMTTPSALPLLVKWLNTPMSSKNMVTVQSFGKFRDAAVVPILDSFLRQSEDISPSLRIYFVKAIGEIGHKDGIPILEYIIAMPVNSSVLIPYFTEMYRAALEAMSSIGGMEVICPHRLDQWE